MTTPTPVVFERGIYGWFYSYVADGLVFEVGPFKTEAEATKYALLDDDVQANLNDPETTKIY